MKQQWLLLLVASLAAGSCGGSSSPPSTGGTGGTGERITGNERLGWNQSAADSAELSAFRYAAYVDGSNRAELTDASCNASGGDGAFPCSSRLPPLSIGSHTLELVSFVMDGNSVIESSRSAPLRLTVVGSAAAAAPSSTAQSHGELTTADGARLRFELVADGLEFPTALAIARDGRVFVAERGGRIRILHDSAVNSDGLRRGPGGPTGVETNAEPALVLDDVLVLGASGGGLLGLALDPEFERTRFVYAIYTSASREAAPVFRLARFREAGGRLGERLVLLDQVPASAARPAGAIGFGPDGNLYVAFDDAGDPRHARQLASFNGKILRLNAEGTTPADQPASSPIYATDYRSPRGFDWHPVTGALWSADETGLDTEELRVVGADAARSRQSARRVTIPLPSETGALSVVFYRGALIPAFRGDLLLAAGAGNHILRMRFDRRDPVRLVSTERLLQDQVADVSVVSVDTNGAVYFCTDRALLRLAPAAQ
jgi:glucose/arabinose dehydrogenase